MPHGETILFALGMACWLRFVRIHGFGHDPVSTALKYLIGPLEAKSRARIKKAVVIDEDLIELKNDQAIIETKKKPSKSTLAKTEQAFTYLLNLIFDSHPLCPHKGISCVDYSFTPAMTRFGMGYLLRSVLNLGNNPRLLLRDPGQAISNAFTSKNSLKFGLFLGTFVGASKGMHCIMRRITNRNQDWHSAVAGGVSGLSMAFSPKSTLSTYIMWKCLEQYFFLAVQEGKIKRANELICLVYAISVNVLLYIFALEPKFIRPSYMKFIDKISDHKLHQVNRMGKFTIMKDHQHSNSFL